MFSGMCLEPRVTGHRSARVRALAPPSVAALAAAHERLPFADAAFASGHGVAEEWCRAHGIAPCLPDGIAGQ
jgi:hypothetical protein